MGRRVRRKPGATRASFLRGPTWSIGVQGVPTHAQYRRPQAAAHDATMGWPLERGRTRTHGRPCIGTAGAPASRPNARRTSPGHFTGSEHEPADLRLKWGSVNVLSLLLRILLCMSLVANGVGAARASARMTFEHAAHMGRAAAESTARMSAAVAPERSAAACHGTSVRASAPAGTATAAVHASAGKAVAAGEQDCCKKKGCVCECVHASSATFVSYSVTPLHVAGDRAPVRVDERPQPRLPHRIRPPIG